MMTDLDLYRSMVRIRRFEETILEEFKRGVFAGTTHTSIGQEANAVGVISTLQPEDLIVTNHRCHGHFLAYGGDMRSLFAEMMGRSTGICGGRGGSQHIHWRNLYSNGVQGGTVPIAAGMALAEKIKHTNAVVTVFIGDGTFGEGVIYEAFNMVSLWGLPLLIIVEDNGIAQTTPTKIAQTGRLSERVRAFGIPVIEMDSSDVRLIGLAAGRAVEQVRRETRPQSIFLHTSRFAPHSKGDDTRSEAVIQCLKETRDPLKILAGALAPEDVVRIHHEVESEVRLAFEQALADPEATFEARV
ncbi:MAG: thiamine pyrophosphate-dependent dehydrogenase E1 component subunit alpha [Anaerolineaceae bacterium]